MKLSEAIRLGAMLGPQAFHEFEDGNGGTCAMGAALLAVGRLEAGLNFPASTFPGVIEIAKGKQVSLYPWPKEYAHVIWDEIAYRNNELRMTREQIADWLVESGNDCESVAPEQKSAETSEPTAVLK